MKKKEYIRIRSVNIEYLIECPSGMEYKCKHFVELNDYGMVMRFAGPTKGGIK